MENTNNYALVPRTLSKIRRKLITFFFKGNSILPTVVGSKQNLKEDLYHPGDLGTQVFTDVRSLSDPDTARAIHDEIIRQHNRIEILVNATRRGLCGEFTAKDLQSELLTIRLNICTLDTLTSLYINEAKVEN